MSTCFEETIQYQSYPFSDGIYVDAVSTAPMGEENGNIASSNEEVQVMRVDGVNETNHPKQDDGTDSLHHEEESARLALDRIPSQSQVHLCEQNGQNEVVELPNFECPTSPSIRLGSPFAERSPACSKFSSEKIDDGDSIRWTQAPTLGSNNQIEVEVDGVNSQASVGEEKRSLFPRMQFGIEIPSSSPIVPAGESPCPQKNKSSFSNTGLKRARTSVPKNSVPSSLLPSGIFDWLNVEQSNLSLGSTSWLPGSRCKDGVGAPEPSWRVGAVSQQRDETVIPDNESQTSPPSSQIGQATPGLDACQIQDDISPPIIEVSSDAPMHTVSFATPVASGELHDNITHSSGIIKDSNADLMKENLDRLAVRGAVLKRPFKSPSKVSTPHVQAFLEPPSSSPTICGEEMLPSRTCPTSSPLRSSPSHKKRKLFKSPMGPKVPTQVSGTSVFNIQELERRVQVLKRAIKILAEEDGNKLEVLSRKWQEKGRDVANQLVAETSVLESNWGNTVSGDGDGEVYQGGVRPESHESQGESGQEEDQEEKASEDIGALLTTLGVPLHALGWSEAS